MPDTVEGNDYSGVLTGEEKPSNDAALITCPAPFGQWRRQNGGQEYRGIRTRRYTYVRSLKGPWLLFDNQQDPYQLSNLVNNASHRATQQKLDRRLAQMLVEKEDDFDTGWEYIKQSRHQVDDSGTAPYVH